jgi:hypothetical protein
LLATFVSLASSQDDLNKARETANALITLETLPVAVAAANLWLDGGKDRKPGDAPCKAIRSAVYRVKRSEDDENQLPYTLSFCKVSKRFILGRATPRAKDMPDLEISLRDLIHKYGSRQVAAMVKALAPDYRPVKKSGPIMKSQSLRIAA